jgi:class 3 adenylate cyclase
MAAQERHAGSERWRRLTSRGTPWGRAVDLGLWLRGLGMAQYEQVFRVNHIDVELLPDLRDTDLRDIGIVSLGHRKKLLGAIAALDLGTTSDKTPAVFAGPAERRHVTVLFCDLVGSTELSSRLDPEDLGQVILAYQALVRELIARFGGFIARYVGDGVLIYFGWPAAQETDAERAVRAALAVASAVNDTKMGGENLQVRIGIATGLVVVGEPIGAGDARQQTAIGETPYRAARLQGLAGPNGVAIDAATRQQIGGLFDCRDVGAVALKGLPEPVHAWLVHGESGVASRFEALRSGRLAPLIGREEELDLLLRRWRQAALGEGRVVLLCGEPGIGKSRLLAALEERLQGERSTRLKYFCSPYHQDSPLAPIIGQLERAAGLARGDTDADRLSKLRALLATTATSDEDTVPLAELLSLPTEGVLPRLTLSPQRRKERTFAVLVRQVEVLAQRQPVLMLLEDAHWADPSSRELFSLVIERLAGLPMLLVMTFRPEFQPPWIGLAGVSLLALSRFDRRETATMAAQVAARAMPTELIERIVAQTDGVPLFIEEITRAVLETGFDDASRLAVPATLQASLLTRLDQLPAAKTVAQFGAVIGRSFPHELIAAIAQLPEPALLEGLHQLVGSGLAFQRGAPPEASYTFKHALVQDAVYQTLLRSRRETLHGLLVDALLLQEPGIERADPGLLAHHCEQSGRIAQAVDYYTRAGRQSAVSCAFAEAGEHFAKARRMIAMLPEEAARDRIELDLLLTMRMATGAQMGFAGSAVRELEARTAELRQRLGEPPERGIRQVFSLQNRADIQGMLRFASGLLGAIEGQSNPHVRIIGHLSAGGARMLSGELAEARRHLEEVISLHQPLTRGLLDIGDAKDSSSNPWGPWLQATAWLGLVTCWLGYPVRALTLSSMAVEKSRSACPIDEVADMLAKHVELSSWLHEPAKVAEPLSELISIADKYSLESFGPRARITKGYIAALEGETETGRKLIEEGLSCRAAAGFRVWRCHHLALLAQTYRLAGQVAEALSILTEALDLTEQTGEKWYAAELHRHMGETHRQCGDDAAAEACFKRALSVARSQNAKLWELQAATSHARLLRDEGKGAEAYALLAPVHSWFTEGFDTIPWRDTKVLLDELG